MVTIILYSKINSFRRIDLEREQFKKELKHIHIRCVFLNISAYLISVFFIGFTIPMAVGLLMGTAGMTVNLILLNKSIRNIVKSGGCKAQSRMFGGYIIRLSVVGAVVVSAMLLPFVNTAGSIIPFFYPQLVFAGNVILRKGEKT